MSRRSHVLINNHSYKIVIGRFSPDGIMKYDSNAYINLWDDSSYQVIARSMNHNPAVFKLEEYDGCWSFRGLDDSCSKLEYKQVPCDNTIQATLISRLPKINIQNFFTGKLVSLDSIAALHNSEKLFTCTFYDA